MRVVCIAGARPNFMKIAPVLVALDEAGADTVLVHTGQHYDEAMSQVFFEELDIRKPVSAYVPELKAKDKKTITVEEILTHSGGFEAGAPLYAKYRGRAAYLTQINKRKLEYKPGAEAEARAVAANITLFTIILASRGFSSR